MEEIDEDGSVAGSSRRRRNTLGDLLNRVGKTTQEGSAATGEDDDHDGDRPPPPSPLHDLDDTGMARSSRFVLSFTDIFYSVKNPTRMGLLRHADGSGGTTAKRKTLLDSVSGEAREGEILAVLGASGAGKSTLIDALANRISRGSLKGTVALNGESILERSRRPLLKAISAYVMQDDLLFPLLTVEETLMFSAELRLPRSLSRSKKRDRVQALIDQLGLRAAAGTVIGDEAHRGVSGGERRRVSIGVDTVHDPILLFLDEPTSGLDSTSAFMVVTALRRIARTGSVVVMSIHQPSYRILCLLDRLIFLSRGRAVYDGAPTGLRPFFAEFGRPVPEKENPAEFALDQIRELEGSPGGTDLLADFFSSRRRATSSSSSIAAAAAGGLSLREAISASISRGKLVSGVAKTTATSSSSSVPTFANPIWIEVFVLMRRSFTNGRRQPEQLGTRLAVVLMTGFIYATLYWRLGLSIDGIRLRLGFFAMAMATMFYTSAYDFPEFLLERNIFMRETAFNAYRRSSYVLANAAVAIPSLVLLSLAFAAATFFAVGLAGGFPGFVFYFLIVLAAFWSGSSFMTFMSGLIPHIDLGFLVVMSLLSFFMLFGGFFISRDRTPSYWLWFHYMSLMKYPYEAVLQNEFDRGGRCFVRGQQMFDATPLRGLTSETKGVLLQGMSSILGVNISATTCVTDGPYVLRLGDFDDLTKWNCLWITLAWGFLFRVLFYFALLVGSKNKRR